MRRYTSTEFDFRQYKIPPVRKNRKYPLIFFLFLFFLLLWAGLMLYLPYFQITKITYYGLQVIQKEEIDSFLKDKFFRGGGVFPAGNYFLIRANKISKALTEHYSLRNIEVKKVFPDELLIDVEEKPAALIYDNGREYFLLDNTGTAVKFLGLVSAEENKIEVAGAASLVVPGTTSTSFTPTTSLVLHTPDYRGAKEKYGNFPVLFDERNPEIKEKQNNIISPEVISGISVWQEMCEKEGIGPIKYYSLEDPLAGIKAYGQKNLLIYFQPNKDISSQIENLKIILRDYKPANHVDLRFGERLYWE